MLISYAGLTGSLTPFEPQVLTCEMMTLGNITSNALCTPEILGSY